MLVKSIAISLALAQFASAAEYWESFKSQVDPKNITLPKIAQTTSYDEVTQCTYYEPTNFQFVESEWPTPWEIATSNGMNSSQEFRNLVNSINWKAMPNITARTMGADGAIDMSNYDEAKDPDCWWSATTCTEPKHEGVNPDIYACPEPETWGLTYDDGPNCSHNAFYDYLEAEKLKATMFYIGSNVVDWPYGAQRGVKDGHQIADHTWSHQMMTSLSNEEVLAELYYTQKAIKMVTGVTPRHWRPAFGDVDDRVRWIATQLNLTTVLWNLDTDDWAAGNTEPLSQVQGNYEDFIKMGSNGTFATSGNIVLTHEIDNTTMQLALDYLPQIKKNYKHILDVATCMNITYPYMEKTVSFAGVGNTSTVTSAVATAAGSATSSSSASSSDSAQTAADKESSASKVSATGALALALIIALFA
ncbi:chitin deacetylase 1 [Phascolomyces articulosus]|uniref:chitin deacetylase n=1 Tax=Phascolomyces articulosus TaxID=60185 RepID=A0AAD5PDL0_9FUNG|nr:chitin deacetylase 1 [Phascolomyces articulosus]